MASIWYGIFALVLKKISSAVMSEGKKDCCTGTEEIEILSEPTVNDAHQPTY